MNNQNHFPNGNFPPFGYNDNNFNRQHVPSNVYPQNGGQPGNMFGNYNPQTTNVQKQYQNNPSMSSFIQGPNTTQPMIERMDYANYNNTVHNNVGDSVLDEHIVEYRVNIDSLDRDIDTYPNPFSFKVQLDTVSSGNVRTESIKNGKLIAISERFKGPPGPHINKKFRNVKYVKLDTIILPRHKNIVQNDEGEFILDTNDLTLDDRFVNLVVSELDCNRIYSTSDSGVRTDPKTGEQVTPPSPFAMIIPDKIIGKNYYSGTPYFGSRIYNSSKLGNLNTLTIELVDSCGVPLKYDHLYDNCVSNECETCTSERICHNGCDNRSHNDVRHPLNKKIQVYVSFLIGVVESQINTNTKFEK